MFIISTQKPLKYFPVSSRPLQMSAGFNPWPGPLAVGNQADVIYAIQRDQELSLYQDNKKQVSRSRHWVSIEHDKHYLLHARGLKQLLEYWQEHDDHFQILWQICHDEQKVHLLSFLQYHVQHTAIACASHYQSDSHEKVHSLYKTAYHTLALYMQEDIALLADIPQSSLVMGHICAPSFWAPEHIKNASFAEIHRPIPGFPKNDQVAAKLASTIAKRGPFVRFVWTVVADQKLDHHPDNDRIAFKDATEIYLRVERQTTVPLDRIGALFLIRTYLYAMSDLTDSEIDILQQAIQNMPNEVAHYKGLQDRVNILRLLQANR